MEVKFTLDKFPAEEIAQATSNTKAANDAAQAVLNGTGSIVELNLALEKALAGPSRFVLEIPQAAPPN